MWRFIATSRSLIRSLSSWPPISCTWLPSTRECPCRGPVAWISDTCLFHRKSLHNRLGFYYEIKIWQIDYLSNGSIQVKMIDINIHVDWKILIVGLWTFLVWWNSPQAHQNDCTGSLTSLLTASPTHIIESIANILIVVFVNIADWSNLYVKFVTKFMPTLICRRGLELLVAPNGWVDKTMNIGIKGMFDLIARGYLRHLLT